MIADSIRKHRIEANLTQAQLAEKITMSQQAVASWESGATLPRADLLPKLAEELHCTIDELFDHGESSE